MIHMKLQRDIYRTEQSRIVYVFEGDSCVTLSQGTQRQQILGGQGVTGDCCLVSMAKEVEKQIKCEKVYRHILPPRKFGMGMCFERRNRAFYVR